MLLCLPRLISLIGNRYLGLLRTDTTGMGRSQWRAGSYEVTRSAREGPGAAGRSLAGQHGVRQPNIGPGRPGAGGVSPGTPPLARPGRAVPAPASRSSRVNDSAVRHCCRRSCGATPYKSSRPPEPSIRPVVLLKYHAPAGACGGGSCPARPAHAYTPLTQPAKLVSGSAISRRRPSRVTPRNASGRHLFDHRPDGMDVAPGRGPTPAEACAWESGRGR